MKKKIGLVASLLVPLIVGFASSMVSGNIRGNYEVLNNPPLSPPGIVFPFVWTVLYLLMGYSFYLAVTSRNRRAASAVVMPYAVQLLLNFAWSIIFFGVGQYWIGAFWLLALIVVIIWMLIRFAAADRTAALLQLPYLCWCLFAAYLSFGVAVLN